MRRIRRRLEHCKDIIYCFMAVRHTQRGRAKDGFFEVQGVPHLRK
jgi:hypothetical protein